MLFFFVILLLTVFGDTPCPTPSGGSSRGGKERGVDIFNHSGHDVIIYWVNFKGQPVMISEIGAGYKYYSGSFVSHLFQFRALQSGKFLGEYRVEDKPKPKFNIQTCGDTSLDLPADIAHGRSVEFEALVHDQASPCVGHSSEWSCLKYISPAAFKNRDPKEYGFIEGEQGFRRVGDTEDFTYVSHIGQIPVITKPGYLKMSFTKTMKDLLLKWYEERRKDSIEDHGVVSGGYTNSHKIGLDKINLDSQPEIMNGIIREMQIILQWWAGERLRHTSTFGIRIYREGAMLINHVDRRDTHILSAVIQIGQEADEGWPLEVIPANGKGALEVYLQPGEMVLYEGARLKHGRPLRFKGKEFANVFTHFAPMDWTGVSRGGRKARVPKVSPQKPVIRSKGEL